MADQEFQQATREWTENATQALRDAGRAEVRAETDARAAREGAAAAESPPAPANDNAPKPPAAAPKPGPNAFERAAAREARRAEAEQYRQQVEQIATYARQREPSAQRWDQIQAAHARGDLDGVARLLGSESWGALQDHFVRTLTDPGHARALELERKINEINEREQRAEQQRAAQAQAYQQQQAQRAYFEKMAGEAKASSNEVLREFGSAPAFLSALFEVRGAHYNRTGEELPLEKCLEAKRPNGLTILEELEVYASTADRYRSARKSTTEARPAPAAKPKAAPKADADARPWERRRRREDDAWVEQASREFQRAVSEERKAEEQRRRG